VSAERGCRPDTLVAVAKGRRYGRSEGHGGTQMPRGRSGRRAERLERLEWTEEEIAVLRRAVRLHAMGMARQAAQMVAIRCPFPPELQGLQRCRRRGIRPGSVAAGQARIRRPFGRMAGRRRGSIATRISWWSRWMIIRRARSATTLRT
jgi:hypothetical protein